MRPAINNNLGGTEYQPGKHYCTLMTQHGAGEVVVVRVGFCAYDGNVPESNLFLVHNTKFYESVSTTTGPK